MIDSNIAMGVRPPQIDDPMNSLVKMMGIQKLQQDAQTSQQALADTNKLNELYRTAMGGDGVIDRNRLIQGAASQGLGSHIPKLQKEFIGMDEANGKVDKQNVELLDLKLKQSRQFLDGVTTPEQFLAWHEANHRDPIIGAALASRGITADQSRENILQAMQSPEAFQQLLNQSKLGTEKFIEMNKPTIHMQNLGDTSQIVSVPGLGGAPTVLSKNAIGQSADSKASNATTMRGQNMVDARSRESNQNAMLTPEYKQDAEGNWIALPKKVNAGQPINALPVNGADGKPLTGNVKPLTDAQSKAALFGSRMQSANEILGKMEKSGTVTSMPGLNAGMGVGALLNTVASSGQQQLMQAKRDFVNATLRRESGAVISPSEFDNAEKQYFPQVGDSAEVIKQKANNREVAIRGVQSEIPKASRGVINDIIGKPESAGGFKYLGVVQ